MKKEKHVAGIVLVLAILLGGCGSQITEGEIYEMEFLPECTQTTIIPVVHINEEMTYTTYVPVISHYPDRWKIYIRSEEAENGTYDTAVYYTTEEVYNEYSVGDFFLYDSERDFDEEID